MADIERDKSVIGDNIAQLDHRLDDAREQREISIGLLCDRVCREHSERGIESLYEEICETIGNPNSDDKALICAHIGNSNIVSGLVMGLNLFGDGEPAEAGTHGRIAYVRNKRNDDAFLNFAESIKGARAHYTPTFADACEAVFENKCEFCMLPIENNREGKLYSFYAMLDRYELKICQITEIENEDSSELTVFALVGRRVASPKRNDQRVRLELSVVGESAVVILEVLRVADRLGGTVSSVGTQPVPYDDRSQRIYFAIDINGVSAIHMGRDGIQCENVGTTYDVALRSCYG